LGRPGFCTLKDSGTLDAVQQIANHESPRAIKLCDMAQDNILLDEIERTAI
jgi:hypothetical protein